MIRLTFGVTTYRVRGPCRRGRIYWQKTPDEVHEEVREALEGLAVLAPHIPDP